MTRAARGSGPRPRTFRIHPPPEAQSGGPRTFATHLKAYLEKQGFAWHGGVDRDLGVLIVFVQAPLSLLGEARRLGVPVLLRLDGLYYPAKHGFFHREYLRVNLKVFLIRRFLADLVVYQSAFCEAMAAHLLGPSPKPRRVILNGTPGPEALPAAAAPAGGPLRLVASGRFRGRDMLPATVEALDCCAGRIDFTLDVFGDVEPASRPWLARPWLRHRGPVPNAEVRRALAGYDAMIFTQASASCPNTVVEAVAAGLPVISYDTGAMKELLAFNRELLAGTPSRLLHSPGDFDPVLLAERVERFATGRDAFRREAEAHREDFAEDKTLAGYRAALEDLLAG